MTPAKTTPETLAKYIDHAERRDDGWSGTCPSCGGERALTWGADVNGRVDNIGCSNGCTRERIITAVKARAAAMRTAGGAVCTAVEDREEAKAGAKLRSARPSAPAVDQRAVTVAGRVTGKAPAEAPVAARARDTKRPKGAEAHPVARQESRRDPSPGREATAARGVKPALRTIDNDDVVEAAAPTLPEHERLDRALRQAGGRLKQHFLHFIALAAEVIDKQVWARFGFRNEREYFDERIGVAWRTVVRYLAVHRAIESLPSGQRAAARQQLAQLGVHKAAALAPVIRKSAEQGSPLDWKALADQTSSLSQEAFQEAVTQALGLKPKSATDESGITDKAERFLITQCLPPELQPWAQSIVRGIQAQLERRNFDMVVITLFRIAERDLAAVGIAVDPPPTDTPLFTDLLDNLDRAMSRRRRT